MRPLLVSAFLFASLASSDVLHAQAPEGSEELPPEEVLPEEEPAPDEEEPTERRRPRRLQQQHEPAAPPACPDGQIYDLGVCAELMPSEESWRCQDALRLAGFAPDEQLPSLLVTSCTSIPLPEVCAIPSAQPGDCLDTLCADADDPNRPSLCELEELDAVVADNVRCHYDAFAAVSWAVRSYAPDADHAVADAAAMRSLSGFVAEPAERYLEQAERRLESAVGSRMAMNTFLAYRLLLCGPI